MQALFSFFLRMEGCRKEKNFCEFEQSLVLKQNISMAFDEKKNLVDEARFFPPKDLEYFLINTRHNSKQQTFFSTVKFPAKRLRLKKKQFFDKNFSWSVLIFTNVFYLRLLIVLVIISRQKTQFFFRKNRFQVILLPMIFSRKNTE